MPRARKEYTTYNSTMRWDTNLCVPVIKHSSKYSRPVHDLLQHLQFQISVPYRHMYLVLLLELKNITLQQSTTVTNSNTNHYIQITHLERNHHKERERNGKRRTSIARSLLRTTGIGEPSTDTNVPCFSAALWSMISNLYNIISNLHK